MYQASAKSSTSEIGYSGSIFAKIVDSIKTRFILKRISGEYAMFANRLAIALIMILSFESAAQSAVTLDAIERGRVSENGSRSGTSLNYTIGSIPPNEYRSFWMFDLSNVIGTITAASLRLYNPAFPNPQDGFSSPDSKETVEFVDVVTDLDWLLTKAADIPTFNDFGNGVVYGSRDFSQADNGQFVNIALNSQAITAMNNANDKFAIAGYLKTLNYSGVVGSNEIVFGYTSNSLSDTQLIVELSQMTVPLPASLPFFAISIAGLALIRRRRTKQT